MSNSKISFDQFQSMLRDVDVPDKQIAKYLKQLPGGRSGFDPVFQPDPEKVEIRRGDPLENALTIGNRWCRWRRRVRFERRIASGDRHPVIVSEGDSWFQFPFLIEDVIDHLEPDYLVWSRGAAGDTAQNMVFTNPEYMEALEEQADLVTAFLFSAAGNDIIGEENGEPVLSKLLHRADPSFNTALDHINKAELKRRLDQLENAYLTVIATVRSDRRFADLPVLIHGYDYALPYPARQRDPRRPSWADRDQWLGKPMVDKGIDDPKMRQEIIRVLVDSLYDMMAQLARTDSNVHVINVRGTLSQVSDWADEIHATDEGFARVAALFREQIRKVIPSRSTPRFETTATRDRHVADPFGARQPAYHSIENRDLAIESRTLRGPDSETMGVADKRQFANGWVRTRPTFESAIDEDDSLGTYFLTSGAAAARAVAKIEAEGVDYLGRSGVWAGTGFLIAPNILLTNNHVLNNKGVSARSLAVFGYETVPPGVVNEVTKFKLNPERLFVTSRYDDLDYTFVWVDGAPQDRFATISMSRGSFLGSEGEIANVIHHPGGDPKRVSLRQNKVIDLGDPSAVLVHYATDTAAGSSGGPVMTDGWRLFALHHASTEGYGEEIARRIQSYGYKDGILNEGVRMSAIAIDIETRARTDGSAKTVLEHFKGTDSRLGFFGAMGRETSLTIDGFERVVDTYTGAPDDVDVAFWNIEWFNRGYLDPERMEQVALVIVDLNLDIWAFEETSPEATAALIEYLKRNFDQEYEFAASEPNAPSGRQTTTVMWNAKTVRGKRLDWPKEAHELLKLRSTDPEARRFEAVEGKLFDRYPGLFHFSGLNRSASQAPFDFNLVPVHLKAKDEGAKRRRMSSAVLAAAIEIARQAGFDEDWIVGGDFNAELSTNQFKGLIEGGFAPMSAADEKGGAITYLSGPRSLIDNIFLSPTMRANVDEDDFMIVAAERGRPKYLEEISDHRPVMIRLSVSDAPGPVLASGSGSEPGTDLLADFIGAFRRDPKAVLRELSDRLPD